MKKIRKLKRMSNMTISNQTKVNQLKILCKLIKRTISHYGEVNEFKRPKALLVKLPMMKTALQALQVKVQRTVNHQKRKKREISDIGLLIQGLRPNRSGRYVCPKRKCDKDYGTK